MRLVLENKNGKVVRSFDVQSETAVVVARHDTRRIEVHTNTDAMTANKIKFELMGQVSRAEIEKAPLKVGEGRLRLLRSEVQVTGADLARNVESEEEGNSAWWRVLSVMVFVQVLLVAGFLTRKTTDRIEQELKQQVVQIIKTIPVKQQKVIARATVDEKQPVTQEVKVTAKTASIKRMGALSAFGSLNKSKQRGGVNLGAVNTTAGVGLGGNAGSGGVQTSLYGKGLVAAPLGAGSNMQGGGGYGTKGKGGGQAGYGKLSLVGSAGLAPIPLGREALIEGGLDKDLINDVIMKNMGQVRFCYEQGLQGEPGLAGRVAVNFVIGGNGQVRTADVGSTSLNSKLVEDCVLLRLRSWKFPLPQGGSDVKVSYPFMFRRQGQG